MSATNRKSRGGRRGRQQRDAVEPAAPAYITRRIPWFDFLNEEALLAIERQADRLLQEVGLDFRDDPETLDIFRAAGAEVHDPAGGFYIFPDLGRFASTLQKNGISNPY